MRYPLVTLLCLTLVACSSETGTTSVDLPPTCPVMGLVLSYQSVTLRVGDTLRTNVVNSTSACAAFALRDDDRFLYAASDTSVASIDTGGLVTARRAGQLTVRVTVVRDARVSGAAQVLVR